jgi:hypothetical protein
MNTNQFFRLVVSNQQRIYGGPLDGGRYSLDNACPVCGTGAVRLEPLKLRQELLPNAPIVITLTFEYLVSQTLAAEIQAEGLSCIRPILDRATAKELSHCELVPEAVLPRFSSKTTGYKRWSPCPQCNRDGYFDSTKEKLMLVYESVENSMLSANCLATYECFGKSRLKPFFRESTFAMPLLLISQTLAQILRTVDHLDLEPVTMLRPV